MQRFRGGLVFKAHRLSYNSTLGLGVIKKKKGWWVEGSGPCEPGGQSDGVVERERVRVCA